MYNIKEEVVEERKGIVAIGMISSGKSTFLNSIFGFNYLQTSDNITTKFICVIRYNPNINEPIFYNLKLIQKSNSNEYIYIKKEKKIKRKKEIKNKIQSINKSLDNLSELQYENLFWMLEINKVIIENKYFMENYDFYDIPGLNEYIKDNENDNQNNIKESKIDEGAAPSPLINIKKDENILNLVEKKSDDKMRNK